MSNVLLKIFTQEQKTILKEYFLSKELELVNLYFAMSPDKPDPDIPFLTERQVLLRFYVNLSEIDPWFHKELLGLREELWNRGAILPNELKQWSYRYPPKSAEPAKRGPHPEIVRDLKLSTFMDMLRVHGHKKKDVVELLCEIINRAPTSIIKAVKKGSEARHQAGFHLGGIAWDDEA